MMRDRLFFWLKVASFPVTAGLWYLVYLAYRRENVEDQSQSSYFESSEKAASYRVITVRVPKRAVGAVIGKGGAVIKGLQETTRARITFINRDVEAEEEEVLIRGLGKNVDEAERQVKNIIDAVPEQLVEETKLASKFIGPLIGRNGENIRAVMSRTGAKIEVEKNSGTFRRGDADPDRTLTIRGTRNEIDDVYQYITDLKNEIVEKEKRSTSLRGTYETLPVGSEPIEVLVSVVMNPNTLFLQLTKSCYALEPLVRQMTTHYASRRHNPQFTYKDGSLVAAVFDGCWHRARVAGSTDEEVDVDYLDYGDAANVPYTDIHPLTEPGFLKLPFQAIEVRLDEVDFAVLTKEQQEEASTYLEKIAYQSRGVQLFAKVVSMSTTPPTVRLLDPNKPDEEKDINEMMKRFGCRRLNTIAN